ncbi:unnamed protein product [Mytilus edulis]|uniref:Farnesoic acid O-methyl transferase domain-containing protein n=1 Tax=Mytilus edulis TaxID=6550 RepID=A0A8S3R8C8_MYTED|nr:unnamed protein product [Mytilus edulis]
MDNSIYEELYEKTIHHQDESKTSTSSNLQTYESLTHQHDSAVVYDSLQTKKFKTTKWKCHFKSRKIAITVFIFLSVVCFLACVIIFIHTTNVNSEQTQTVSKETNGNKNGGYFPNDCENKTILHTPNKYAYRPFILSNHGLFISDKESFSFHVQACNDVHVALLPKDYGNITDESALYEIVIGAYRNTRSIIRKRKQGQSMVERERIGYLNCTEVRQFNIDWSNGNISVRYIMKNSTVETIMAWLDPAPLTIIDAAITTGFGATGTWTFCANDCENKTILHTPNKYAYRPFILPNHGLFISDKESFSFHVQACNDVHVALLPKDYGIITDESALYEIVIGGNRNTRSVIRKRKQEPVIVERERIGYLNCTEVRQINIDWSNGHISVRYIIKNSTVETIMAWLDPAPLTIIDAAITTGFVQQEH